ncbi:MAG: hypothetical protein ABIY52_15805 [Gemmatimonadaceae bacterium]
MRRLLLLASGLGLAACSHHVPDVPAAPSSTAPRAIAVYRTIAESIYVSTTKRVVAVATSSLDSTCSTMRCDHLAARWGVETLWWAKGDSVEARDARDDLLARASGPLDVGVVSRGQSMLFAADPGDVPADGAGVDEWIRFRATHADAAGAVRMSAVGFSRSGKTAVTVVDWRCGPTCGHTLGVALTATGDSSWTISEMLLLSAKKN